MKIQAERLVAGYDKTNVLTNVDVAVEDGEMVGIIGPNGSGKTTLLKPRSGGVYLDGKALREMSTGEVARGMAVLPQAPNAPPELTVRELVSYGRYPHVPWLKRLGEGDREVIDRALSECRLEAMAQRQVSTLSGGERQRAWLAMALSQEPKLMLLDEPVTLLDICHQLEIMDLIAQLNAKRGITVLMVLHDLNLASRYCERLIAVSHGRVAYDGPANEVIQPDVLREVFNVDAYIIQNPHTGRSVCYPFQACAPT
ncbi:MAG: ABC transporter ATP-binding protein [Dehalococcoidia bacterium]|nr:ABC transporter ATP-binding protein [Dehalococcoidia bacterium]